MKRLIAIGIIACIAMSGCATAQTQIAQASSAQSPAVAADTSPPSTLQSIAAADLEEAIAQATADKDTVALTCWQAIKANLGTINKPLPHVRGVASGIQAKRSIKARVDAGLPPEVVSGCAVLYAQEHFGVMKDIMKFLAIVK